MGKGQREKSTAKDAEGSAAGDPSIGGIAKAFNAAAAPNATLLNLVARQILVILPTVAGVAGLAKAGARELGVPCTVVTDPKEKRDAFAASDAALAASGTVAVELAVTGTPAVIGYRANPLSAAIARRMIKVKYASLINLLLDRPATPEFLQENCRPERLAEAIDRLLGDPAAREAQRAAYCEALARLAVEGLPSDRAAAVALSMLGPSSG